MENCEDIIDKLNLIPHKEGGYYKETYRATETTADLSPNFNGGKRSFATAIYYLLRKGDKSLFHRIKSDEIWHHYQGAPVMIYILDNKRVQVEKLGGLDDGCIPQIIIKKGTWFAAESIGSNEYSLCGCTVSPGFDFNDFEIALRSDLIKDYPDDSETILKFTD